MRRTLPLTVLALSTLMLGLSGCGKSEVKTGSLTQRFSMVDSEGRNYGIVELDPINGGSIVDAQGRVVGRIVPPAPTVVATTVPAIQ